MERPSDAAGCVFGVSGPDSGARTLFESGNDLVCDARVDIGP
jgi:hypothetical protein